MKLSKVFLLALSNLEYIIIAYAYHVIHFLLLCGGDLAHMANLSHFSFSYKLWNSGSCHSVPNVSLDIMDKMM